MADQPNVSPEKGDERDSKHSGYGMVSLTIGALMMVFCTCPVLSLGDAGFYACGCLFFLSYFGLCFGLAGLFQKDRKKFLSVLGLIFVVGQTLFFLLKLAEALD